MKSFFFCAFGTSASEIAHAIAALHAIIHINFIQNFPDTTR